MEAVREIGLEKAMKYFFFSFYEICINIVMFSPLKVILLKLAGSKIGKNVVIGKIKFFNLYHKGFVNLEIGNNSFLGDEVMLDLAAKIIIGRSVTIANRATILTHTNMGYKNHPLQRFYPKSFKNTCLALGSFVGVGAIILPGVTIGKEAIVGAGSVVTKDVDQRVVVGGVPARTIKTLKHKTLKEKLTSLNS